MKIAHRHVVMEKPIVKNVNFKQRPPDCLYPPNGGFASELIRRPCFQHIGFTCEFILESIYGMIAGIMCGKKDTLGGGVIETIDGAA